MDPNTDHHVRVERGLASRLIAAAEREDTATVSALLEPLDADQLRGLVTTLATRVASAPAASHRGGDPSEPAARTWASAVPDVGLDPSVPERPEHAAGPAVVCAQVAAAAAATFGTTPEALFSSERGRPVTDARAVAMTAARTTGLTMTAIAEQFGKDHTSVIHAVRRTQDQPRLHDAAARLADLLAAQYTNRLPSLGADPDPQPSRRPDQQPGGQPDRDRATTSSGREALVGAHDEPDELDRVVIASAQALEPLPEVLLDEDAEARAEGDPRVASAREDSGSAEVTAARMHAAARHDGTRASERHYCMPDADRTIGTSDSGHGR